MLHYPQTVTQQSPGQRLSKLVILLVSAIFALIILNAPLSIRSGAYQIQVGDVALQDIQAPRSLSYDSSVLTEQAKQQAMNNVQAIYLPVDPLINKQQVEKLADTLDYIKAVREDPISTTDQKNTDLQKIAGLDLSQDDTSALLSYSQTRWQSVRQEALSLLTEVMRQTIRDDNLPTIRRNLASQIGTNFTNDQIEMISQLVSPFVTPNSLYSAEATEKAKQQAAADVDPIKRYYIAGQLIVQHGQIVKAEDVEALTEFGLNRIDRRLTDLLSSAAIVSAMTLFMGFYGWRRKSSPMDDIRSLILIAVLFELFLLMARFAIPYRAILPFMFPIAAFGLTLAAVFNLETGLIFSLVLSILSAYGLPGSLEITAYYIVGSLIGVLILGRGRRISSFFYATLGITLSNIAIIFAYRVGDPALDWLGLTTLAGASLTNGLASSSLSLILQYGFAQILGVTTALQLLEFSRPDHPLLQFLLRNAPGTYQHSLQVANLAEQAAEAINADSLLVRVGALYHDVGKAVNPQYFIENQIKGTENPHDQVEPAISAAIIIKHVQDSITLGKKFRLPPRILEFMTEHHGNRITRFQYNRAIESASGDKSRVDEKLYHYPGPRPHSRETALLMLADGCEARARAELPTNEAEIRAIVTRVIDFAISEKQLDDTRLTFNDIKKITDSFTSTLMGVYHQRIQYPEPKVDNPDHSPSI